MWKSESDLSSGGSTAIIFADGDDLDRWLSQDIEGAVFGIGPSIMGPDQVAGIDIARPLELTAADCAYAETQNFLDELRLILIRVRSARRPGGGQENA